jgi:hypothetical protein
LLLAYVSAKGPDKGRIQRLTARDIIFSFILLDPGSGIDLQINSKTIRIVRRFSHHSPREVAAGHNRAMRLGRRGAVMKTRLILFGCVVGWIDVRQREGQLVLSASDGASLIALEESNSASEPRYLPPYSYGSE